MPPKRYTGTNDEKLLPSQRTKWQEAAQRKLLETGSQDQAEKYANHVKKSSIQRKLKKTKKEKEKGPFNG